MQTIILGSTRKFSWLQIKRASSNHFSSYSLTKTCSSQSKSPRRNPNQKQEGTRALERSPESWHIRWCIGLWLKRYLSKIFLFLLWQPCCSAELNILINFGSSMRNISVKLFWIWTSSSGDKVVLKIFLTRFLWNNIESGSRGNAV